MKDRQMCIEKDRNQLLGFALAGLALGAAAWYLFGTKDGREHLDRAVEELHTVSSTLQKKAKEGMEYASGLADKANESLHDLGDEAKRKGKDVAKDAQKLANKVAHHANDLSETAKSKLNRQTT